MNLIPTTRKPYWGNGSTGVWWGRGMQMRQVPFFHHHHARPTNVMDWVFAVPPELLCWSPNSRCDGTWTWGLWEVIRFRWGRGGRAPIRRSLSLWQGDNTRASWVCCVKTARRWRSASQGAGPPWEPTLPPHLGLGLPAAWLWLMNVHGILLSQPEWIKSTDNA